MKKGIDLRALLSQTSDRGQQVASFALLCLGTIESLAKGAISANQAIRFFFHADNCLFVQAQLQDEAADEVMGRGVQLPDLFDALPVEKAQQEFQRELMIMHALCLKLVAGKKAAA